MTKWQKLVHIAQSPANNPLVRTRKSRIVKALAQAQGLEVTEASSKKLTLHDYIGVPTEQN